jgi:hypothetical protein
MIIRYLIGSCAGAKAAQIGRYNAKAECCDGGYLVVPFPTITRQAMQ